VGNDWREAERSGCDILSLDWLHRCHEKRRRVLPRAAEFLQVSEATRSVRAWAGGRALALYWFQGSHLYLLCACTRV
jgi:hypothetical protein